MSADQNRCLVIQNANYLTVQRLVQKVCPGREDKYSLPNLVANVRIGVVDDHASGRSVQQSGAEALNAEANNFRAVAGHWPA